MMRVSKNIVVLARGLFLTLVLILGFLSNSLLTIESITIEHDTCVNLAYTQHTAIYIDSDNDFTVFPGDGTAGNPYVIEGLNITTTELSAIEIEGTSKYFTIRNCYLQGLYSGLEITGATSGTASIINNTCNNNYWNGIDIQSCDEVQIINNTCKNNRYGIEVYGSDNAVVTNNTVKDNIHGIYTDAAHGCLINNNTLINNTNIGAHIIRSYTSKIINNTFSNCGLHIHNNNGPDYYAYTVEDNLVNGKQLGYFYTLDSVIFDQPIYGQLIFIDCNNLTIRDQTLNYASIGLYLYYCPNSNIINNTCVDDRKPNEYGPNGMFIRYAANSILENNTCNGNYYGIYLIGSPNSFVLNNTCSFSAFGFGFQSSSGSIIANNTANNNTEEGMDFQGGLNNGIIANNTCNSNDNGIVLVSSSYNQLYQNFFQNNSEYGLKVRWGTENNTVFNNTFIDNGAVGSPQGYDEGLHNLWYNETTLTGNMWSDWTGIGYYEIDGSTNSKDLYPTNDNIETIPPLISDILFSPVSPTELDQIEIFAKVVDQSGLLFVNMSYRINHGAWENVSMSSIGSDVYNVSIGPFIENDTIDFFIYAVDNTSNYNYAFDDNSSFYYSFNITEYIVIPEYSAIIFRFSILPIALFLSSIVVIQRRRK